MWRMWLVVACFFSVGTMMYECEHIPRQSLRMQFPLRYRAFSLIELLVVLGIMGVLISLLIPALGRVRDSVRLAGCLNNFHQINIATSLYVGEHKGNPPIVEPRTSNVIGGFDFGGRYTTLTNNLLSDLRLPYERPLNRYLYPDTPLGSSKTPIIGFLDPEQYNYFAYQCPEDTKYSYALSGGSEKPTHGTSAYETLGSSYAFNAVWLQNSVFEYQHMAMGIPWMQGYELYRRIRFTAPSSFVAYIDEPGNYHMRYRTVPVRSHHGNQGEHIMSFMDAHATQRAFDASNPYSKQHTILFPQQAHANRRDW